MNQKISIDIPKADEKEVAIIPPGKEGVNSELKNKLEKIDQVLYGVMIAVVLSMIAIIILVIGLFLDQMRVNNAFYKEYSQKTEVVENTQNINKELLNQNIKNQETIIEQQRQIKQLLEK